MSEAPRQECSEPCQQILKWRTGEFDGRSKMLQAAASISMYLIQQYLLTSLADSRRAPLSTSLNLKEISKRSYNPEYSASLKIFIVLRNFSHKLQTFIEK